MCKAASDCATGETCAAGVCTPPGTTKKGDGCTATYNCAAGLYCNALGACDTGGTVAEGGSCTADAVCTPPMRCNFDGFFGACGAAGTATAGATCTKSSDCVAGLLCAPNGSCLPPAQAYPPFKGAACADDGPFRVYFEIPRPSTPPKDFFRLPFPNDIRVTDGKLDISDFPEPGPTPLGVDLVKLYVDTWTADFDGFSVIAPATFRFSAPIDDTTVGNGATMIVDLAPDAKQVEYARSWVYAPSRTKYSCENRFSERVTPDAPLVGGHTYAVILTTAIKSKMGETPVVDADMQAMLSATAPTDATLMHAWTAYQPLRTWLASKGAAAPAVAAAAVFTVQDAPARLQRLAAAVAKAPAPTFKDLTLCAPGVKSPCDDGTPARECPAVADPAFDEIHGRFSVPIFQKGAEPYELPVDGAGGIVEDANGPIVQRTEDVCFAMSVPKATAPAKGWPLVVYHHGTGGSMRSIFDDGVAAAMAKASSPAVVFGWDAVEHGARRGASTKKPDDLVFNPLNPEAARDNFLQGAADVLQALRVAGAGPLLVSTGGRSVAFSGTQMFFGHSQGSTSGALAVSVTDAAPTAVFSGAGSWLTHSLLDKTNPVNIAAGMVFLIGEPLDDQHPVLTLFQSFFDRSDPLGYNPLVIKRPPTGLHAKNVYMSWGTKDTYTPPSTLNANGLSLGLPVAGTAPPDYYLTTTPRPATQNLASGDAASSKVTAVMVPYTSGADYDGHFVASKNADAIADWTAFLTSYIESGAPTLP
ncbi:MAG TPA: hypothetical protein VHJ20_12200 [Polyangia bacterium]|nr:hypothetical protein [Polyangia bacterium]